MKDNFSKQAAIYARYRPSYPQALFDFLFELVKQPLNAWDCATGNGQSAKVLATRFENVFATDISMKQLDHAEAAENIHYSVQPADHTQFPDNQFDLVTISQALHWFATQEFYSEVNRVAKNGAILAAWCYSLLNVSPEIDQPVNSFYKNIIGPYWDLERKYVDEAYRTILFPYQEITPPVFTMQYRWTIEEFEGYLNTWSAVQKFITANQFNPVNQVIDKVRPFWKTEYMDVNFPLYLRVGQIRK
jgi:ubiquinone/menaquinone biosynthesis C-methylase UbiE